jgi:L-alanine-DL-glutamate epimerase-like enolase superfamily enzyme
MTDAPAATIERIETTEFTFELDDLGTDANGFNLVYDPGSTAERSLFGISIETDVGVTGRFVCGNSPGFAQVNMVADYLVGRDAFARERHWSEMKRALRKFDRMGLGPLDVALWDLAGKYHDAPIHELLGTYRTEIPAYASTYHGDENGGLDSPAAFADFAAECRDMGYPAFKIHGWGGSDASRDIDREVETVHAVGERVPSRGS